MCLWQPAKPTLNMQHNNWWQMGLLQVFFLGYKAGKFWFAKIKEKDDDCKFDFLLHNCVNVSAPSEDTKGVEHLRQAQFFFRSKSLFKFVPLFFSVVAYLYLNRE